MMHRVNLSQDQCAGKNVTDREILFLKDHQPVEVLLACHVCPEISINVHVKKLVMLPVSTQQKIIRILREQVESLNATKNELGVDDDTLQQWVADVQKWAEDSNKRRHRIRKVILDEKKRLAAAVDDYNKLAEPTKQIVSSDALIQTDIWPWQSTSEPAADLQTKRKVFEKVMAVRRLREEEMILCREMRHHWTVLRMRSVVLGTISSDSSFVGMLEDAQKGLHSLVLKKQSELKAEMLKVKDEEEDIPDDATESDLSTSDED
ncbi:C1q-related factor [Sarotherodon galilaeus]